LTAWEERAEKAECRKHEAGEDRRSSTASLRRTKFFEVLKKESQKTGNSRGNDPLHSLFFRILMIIM
jgi:hypothetical protein